jgi:hypothetical protein
MFTVYLVEKYGADIIQWLLIKKQNRCKMGKVEIDIIGNEYREKTKTTKRSRIIEKQYTLRSLARPDDPFGEADAKEEGIKEQVIYENNLTYSADLIELRQNIIRALWQYLRWVSLIPGQKPQALSSLVENLIDACLDWAEGK